MQHRPWASSHLASPTSDFATTSTRIEEPFTGRFVPCIHRVERRDMTTRWLAEVEDVGDNQLCAVAFGPVARLLIVTERGVALTEADGRRIAFDGCAGGRAIAATADGRYALVACADAGTFARLYEVTASALSRRASFAVPGQPWAVGDRLFLATGARDFEVLGAR
ncbi:MAG: hypothetical protein IPJ34_32305 [Myxococcales bacterium]|nr:hypothetical protein [Myxococcales bacterium]